MFQHISESEGKRRSLSSQNTKEKLVLTLEPDAMDYADDWVVLASSSDPDYGYLVVAYRGSNAAWDGYGGLDVYTRRPYNFRKIEEKATGASEMVRGIKLGLRKLGIDLDDMILVDNTCS